MSELSRDPLPLRGRVALVTGVSRRQGIGYAIARRLAAYGASVFLHHFQPHDREQPWGTVEVRRGFDRAVRRVVRRLPDVRFVDVGQEVGARYTVADYADGDHLNPAGATRFSRDLAAALAPELGPGTLAERPVVGG